jgi:hypothetical protein
MLVHNNEYGRSYTNPLAPEIGTLVVTRTIPLNDVDYWRWGARNQEVVRAALAAQLAGRYSLAEVTEIADPFNHELIARQVDKMQTGIADGTAIFAHANLNGTKLPSFFGQPLVGIAKTQFADLRSHSSKIHSPNPEAAHNTVDIRGLYVRPHLQHNGIGSAMLHFLLSQYHSAMPTILGDYPDANPDFQEVITGTWDFVPHRDKRGRLGSREERQRIYHGPRCWELLELLEEMYPWFAQSEVIDWPKRGEPEPLHA